jgi:hypothetical protein
VEDILTKLELSNHIPEVVGHSVDFGTDSMDHFLGRSWFES